MAKSVSYEVLSTRGDNWTIESVYDDREVPMIAKPHNPPSLHLPFSAYSLGMEVSGAERWLHLSGQVGVKKDGSVPAGTEGQMEECWAKIFAILDSAGMEKGNLIKVTGFLTRPDADGGLRGRAACGYDGQGSRLAHIPTGSTAATGCDKQGLGSMIRSRNIP